MKSKTFKSFFSSSKWRPTQEEKLRIIVHMEMTVNYCKMIGTLQTNNRSVDKYISPLIVKLMHTQILIKKKEIYIFDGDNTSNNSTDSFTNQQKIKSKNKRLLGPEKNDIYMDPIKHLKKNLCSLSDFMMQFYDFTMKTDIR